MEQSNVNNLNGVPNFGHGEVIPKTEEVGSVDEVKDTVETDEDGKVKRTSKSKKSDE